MIPRDQKRHKRPLQQSGSRWGTLPNCRWRWYKNSWPLRPFRLRLRRWLKIQRWLLPLQENVGYLYLLLVISSGKCPNFLNFPFVQISAWSFFCLMHGHFLKNLRYSKEVFFLKKQGFYHSNKWFIYWNLKFWKICKSSQKNYESFWNSKAKKSPIIMRRNWLECAIKLLDYAKQRWLFKNRQTLLSHCKVFV